MEDSGSATLTGALLRQWREEAGMNLDRAAVYAEDKSGRTISSEKVRKYETEKPEAEMDPQILAGLIATYGKKASDLPPHMAEKVGQLRELLDSLCRCATALIAA